MSSVPHLPTQSNGTTPASAHTLRLVGGETFHQRRDRERRERRQRRADMLLSGDSLASERLIRAVRECIMAGTDTAIKAPERGPVPGVDETLTDAISDLLILTPQECSTDWGKQEWHDAELAHHAVAIDWTDADYLPCDPKGEPILIEDDYAGAGKVTADVKAWLVAVGEVNERRWAVYSIELVGNVEVAA